MIDLFARHPELSRLAISLFATLGILSLIWGLILYKTWWFANRMPLVLAMIAPLCAATVVVLLFAGVLRWHDTQSAIIRSLEERAVLEFGE